MAQAELSVPVVFVSSHARAGGAERYLETLAEQLGPSWVKCVICLEEGRLAERLRSAGIPTEVLPTSPRALGIVGSALGLRRLLARERPAVVHANGIKAALVSVLAFRGPVVWVKHDFSFDGPLARFVAGRCRLVVGVSEAVTKTFNKRVRARKVEVVHNGVPPMSVDREAGRRLLEGALGGPVDEVVALVGRLEPVKGPRELLAIAGELRKQRPGVRIVLVGGADPSHPDYQVELRREFGNENVAFLGHREDAVALISGCDIVVIPTVVIRRGFGREGFPFVGLEAMAVGTPLVGYAHGGLPELVGSCGRLVPPGDRSALKEEIIQLLEDRELWNELASCGQARVAREFSLERMVDAMKDRYRRAAGN